MGAGFATVSKDDGVVLTSASVNGFELSELRFPDGYIQGAFEPERPYLAVVLSGALEKTFVGRRMSLEGGSALTMPAGAKHGARFGSSGARIVIVMSKDANGCFEHLVELNGRELGWLATRLAGELRAADTAAPLAAEGYALELLAATTRETSTERRAGRDPAWLKEAEEYLRESKGETVGLGDLAKAINVHPTHLARTFRARYGVSVGEYGRRLRLARAATELARTETPLSLIATEAGFADQSHFTRVFRRYVGTTPARFREATRVPS
jgi:AraC family transcriptional regulator